jgi:hypothetical protein
MDNREYVFIYMCVCVCVCVCVCDANSAFDWCCREDLKKGVSRCCVWSVEDYV